jgi:hypothetical protein
VRLAIDVGYDKNRDKELDASTTESETGLGLFYVS